MSRGPGLVVMPFVDCLAETNQAAMDALLQLDERADLLLIDQGSSEDGREWGQGFSALSRVYSGRIRLWRHAPPMPSLAATWNSALDYAWELGHEDVMVWNNDIRVHPDMYRRLRGIAELAGLWFTTPVNCAGGENPEVWREALPALSGENLRSNFGGPDFSCFLISRACHDKYRFDERFQPAYHEDGDFHRRMWLGGDGDKIAGVTLPYLHYGSRTIHRSNEAASAFAPLFAACRARYIAKWGGEPHHERKIVPDSSEDLDGVGTPGGYLDQHLKMPEGYAEIRYPKHQGVITGLADEKKCHCVCGARGFRKAWGTRASGAKYNGCTFCTGEEGNADNENGTGVRGIGHLPWDQVDNPHEWRQVPRG